MRVARPRSSRSITGVSETGLTSCWGTGDGTDFRETRILAIAERTSGFAFTGHDKARMGYAARSALFGLVDVSRARLPWYVIAFAPHRALLLPCRYERSSTAPPAVLSRQRWPIG